MGYSWERVKTLAKNRVRWRINNNNDDDDGDDNIYLKTIQITAELMWSCI